MSCCGQTRAAAVLQMPSQGRTVRPSGPAWFEYIGRTAVTVTGTATGRTYRFDGPGARLEAHPADRAALYQIPVLRQVDGPGL